MMYIQEYGTTKADLLLCGHDHVCKQRAWQQRDTYTTV